MNTPISWIKAYVPDLDCTVQEYVDKMTLSGSHVENAVYLDKNLEKIVVGRIEKIEKHPDADKLLVSQINIGKETRQIVSGIADFYTPEEMIGKKVIVVANLKPAKLRGVESQGMILAGSKKKVLELATVQSLPNGTKIR